MPAPITKALIIGWTPLRQWVIALVILLTGWIFYIVPVSLSWAYHTIYVSLLMLACMNPVINAVNPSMRKNTTISFGLFIIHASLCYFLLGKLNDKGMEFQSQLFMVIIIFYPMAIVLSGLFRGIYLLISEQLR